MAGGSSQAGRRELKRLHARHMELEQQAKAFQPQLENLNKARRAKELEGDYTRIAGKRDEQEKGTHRAC